MALDHQVSAFYAQKFQVLAREYLVSLQEYKIIKIFQLTVETKHMLMICFLSLMHEKEQGYCDT